MGTRVVRGSDWTWRDQDGGEGHLGTVAEVQVPEQADGDEEKKAEGGRAPCVATVQWDCGSRCRYRCGLGGKYDLRVFDSGPAGEGELLATREKYVCLELRENISCPYLAAVMCRAKYIWRRAVF